MAGGDMVHIAYKGTGAVMPDLLSGRVPMMFENLAVMTPHIKKGLPAALGRFIFEKNSFDAGRANRGRDRHGPRGLRGPRLVRAPGTRETPANVVQLLNAELKELSARAAD
jgi:hypothetical protein